MNRLRILGIVAATAVATTALTGLTVATAATEDDSATTSESRRGAERPDGPGRPHGPGHPGRPGHGPGVGGDLLHAEIVVDRDGTTVTLQVQHGEATAVSATSITVASSDGFTATYAITDETVSKRGRGAAGSPEVGDVVHVAGVVDGTSVTAERIHALSPEEAAEREAHRPDRGDGPGRGDGPQGGANES